jgi:hypothetical protein
MFRRSSRHVGMTNKILFLAALLPMTASAEPLPKPVENMECLVGTWKGGGTVAMGKDKSKVDLTWTCSRVSQKWGVLCTFHVTGIPGMASYDETDLMGYEPNTNTYHWYSVTNAGETHDHVAPATESNKLEFVFTGTQEGKPLKEVIDLEFAKDSKSFTGRAETFVAGASASVMELKAKKS